MIGLTIKDATVHSRANVIGLGDRDVVDTSGEVHSTTGVSSSHIRTVGGSIHLHNHLHIWIYHSLLSLSILLEESLPFCENI